MVGHTRKELPQPVLFNAETESLFQHVGRLFENDHLETVANTADLGCRFADRQRTFADHENVIRRKIGACWDWLSADADRFQEFGSLAPRIEQRYFRKGTKFTRRRDERQHVDNKTILLCLAASEFGDQSDFIAACRKTFWQFKVKRDSRLFASGICHLALAGDCSWQ